MSTANQPEPASVAEASRVAETWSETVSGQPAGAGEGFWPTVWRQFRHHTLAMAGLYVAGLLFIVALSADFLANDKPLIARYQGEIYFPVLREYAVRLGLARWPGMFLNIDFRTDLNYDFVLFPPIPYTPNNINLAAAIVPPDSEHWLGTDEIGRDVLSGMIHGSRISLSVGFVSVGIAAVIGIVLGALGGYYGGRVDTVIVALIEIMLTFPTFFLIITIIAFLPPSIFLIMAVIGLTGWTGIARFTRGEFLRIRNLDFVTAAEALGLPTSRIIFRHILPNALAPVLVSIAFGIASAILIESSLTFLGFGAPATTITWGSILSDARGNTYAWWLAVFPGVAIFLTVTAFNLVGEGLRDALDPRLQ